ADADDTTGQAERFRAAMQRSAGVRSVRLFTEHTDQQALWEIRESGLAATARVSGRHPTWPGWEDSAVPPQVLGRYLRDLDHLIQSHGYEADLYGHFGDGCVDCHNDFQLRAAAGIERRRGFMKAAADLVGQYKGS